MFENLQNMASIVQLQFKGMNISTFSTKLPILVKTSATVIEILSHNKWCTTRRPPNHATHGGLVKI